MSNDLDALEAMALRWEADLALLTGFVRESLAKAIEDLTDEIREMKEET